jgi:hypothetical protein
MRGVEGGDRTTKGCAWPWVEGDKQERELPPCLPGTTSLANKMMVLCLAACFDHSTTYYFRTPKQGARGAESLSDNDDEVCWLSIE